MPCVVVVAVVVVVVCQLCFHVAVFRKLQNGIFDVRREALQEIFDGIPHFWLFQNDVFRIFSTKHNTSAR